MTPESFSFRFNGPTMRKVVLLVASAAVGGGAGVAVAPDPGPKTEKRLTQNETRWESIGPRMERMEKTLDDIRNHLIK